MADVQRISTFIQEELGHRALAWVTAVEAGKWLQEAGILRDSPTSPGRPLRDLLRLGQIEGQRQEVNGRWYIDWVQAPALRVPSRRLRALPHLIRLAESSLSVMDIAETKPWFARPEWSARLAHARMVRKDFDVAPVSAEPPREYVVREDLANADGSVGDWARPIDVRRLVGSSLSLARGIEALRDRGYFFVLEGSRLGGIVTSADLQKPAVSMLALFFILAAESEMNRIILNWYGEGWLSGLSPNRRTRMTALLVDRRRHNAEISPLECVGLEDRLTLIGKQRALRERLGFASVDHYHQWARRLRRDRDALAHGGTLLDARPEPSKAIELVSELRQTALVLGEIRGE